MKKNYVVEKYISKKKNKKFYQNMHSRQCAK